MSYLHYHSSRSREANPYATDDYTTYTARPLVRRNSKRQRVDIYDDDEYDDYPYSSSHTHSKPSRALTIRQQPSTLEKYNVWSYPSTSHSHKSRHSSDDDDDRTTRYKYTTKRYSTKPTYSDDDDDEDEREFRLKVRATFGKSGKPSRSSSLSRDKAMAWPGTLFKRREKWDAEDWESRERERGDRWFDEPETERTVRYRRIKRTRTDEWKPLSGFRRL